MRQEAAWNVGIVLYHLLYHLNDRNHQREDGLISMKLILLAYFPVQDDSHRLELDEVRAT